MVQKALIQYGINKAIRKAGEARRTPSESDKKFRQKLIIGGIVVTGVVITSILLKKQIGKLIQKFRENNELQREIKGKGTLPPSQYRDLANSIQKAFMPYEFYGTGTDEKTIYNAFRLLKNNDDFLLLKNAYGIREYKDYLGGALPGFGKTYQFNLSQAINYEDEGGQMVKLINNILKVKGITYRI